MEINAQTVSGFEIFSELSSDERSSVAAQMSCRQYFPGNYIIPASDDSYHVYFLLSGDVKVCAYSETGKQVYFENLHPGMMFGELAAIDGGERTSDCICMQTSYVASLSKQSFRSVLHQYPSVNEKVLLRLVALVRRQIQRVYEYTSYSVNQRIRFELLRLASGAENKTPPIELTNVPTQAELADRISSHREAVARELKRLESEGLITWSRRVHIVHDPDALLERARTN